MRKEKDMKDKNIELVNKNDKLYDIQNRITQINKTNMLFEKTKKIMENKVENKSKKDISRDDEER